jgi:hypothetical protein
MPFLRARLRSRYAAACIGVKRDTRAIWVVSNLEERAGSRHNGFRTRGSPLIRYKRLGPVEMRLRWCRF